jgi:hypothetical protein
MSAAEYDRRRFDLPILNRATQESTEIRWHFLEMELRHRFALPANEKAILRQER